ncbi:MAG: hypothetical protein O7B26_14090 [Planctomycetota bacterium]|nr:hypothetical protein [Planctomycetota bacterium]
MSNIDRQVRQAQRRLWFNRWLRQWGWALMFATIAWMLTVITDRLFALGLPLGWLALAGLAASLVGSFVWLALTREPTETAAAALDTAAGLRERVSTGLHCAESGDPFAQAVMADAEKSVAGLSARRFIPIRWSGSLSISGIALAVAAISLLLPVFDILNKNEAQAKAQQVRERRERVRVVVEKPAKTIEDILEKNPDLDVSDDLKNFDDQLRRMDDMDPGAIRREAIKKLDTLEDALKKKADSNRFQDLNETKKRLAKIGASPDPKSEVGRLLDAMASNDFQEAQKAIEKLKEELAKRSRDPQADLGKLQEMQKQLEQLSQKMKEAAEDKRSERELKNAGLTPEQAKRVLEALAKKDPKQLEKMAKELAERLKDKGMTEEQMKKMLEKMQQRQKACKQCKKMGDKMGGAAEKMKQGDMESASMELGEAGDMLNEMEQMEQALNELESQMAELNDARDELGDDDKDSGDCKKCDGTGFRKDGAPCPDCNRRGPGMAGGGRGWGERERDDNAEFGFKNVKAKIKTNKRGRIIGQRYVKGDALKNKSEAEFHDAASAAELDATDALNRDRVPRAYRKGVKKYFERLRERAKPADSSADETKPDDAATSG